MLDYCDKCGWVWERDIKKKQGETCGKCEICGNQLKPVPNQYYEEFQGIRFLSDIMKQKLIEELVFTSQNFDQYYFDNAIDIKGQKEDIFKAKIDHGKAILEEQSLTPKCPSCGSSNISKIGVVGRAVSFGLVGFASSKIGKTHKCNNCGTTW
ncbi:MAG: hypothetical protein K1W26_16365 [Acetatifactor sp.]